MQFFVGIDVSLASSNICVIDERGIIIKEGKVESDPQNIARFIRHKGLKIEHVGLEAGRLSEWLFVGLSREGFKVSVLESRHVRAAFAAMRVKTERNDARGIAQLIRLGWFKSVHVKTLNARETRSVLNARLRALQLAQKMAQPIILRQCLIAFGNRDVTLGPRCRQERLQRIDIHRRLRMRCCSRAELNQILLLL
jgi:transposase